MLCQALLLILLKSSHHLHVALLPVDLMTKLQGTLTHLNLLGACSRKVSSLKYTQETKELRSEVVSSVPNLT